MDREALLDAVATEAYLRLAASLVKAKTPRDYTAICPLCAGQSHTLRPDDEPSARHHEVQPAAAKRRAQGDHRGIRIFSTPDRLGGTAARGDEGLHQLYGGISLYAAGILDQPNEKALIAELSAMNAKM